MGEEDSYLSRAKEIFSSATMMQRLGLSFVDVGEDWAEMVLTPDERVRNYQGGLHGGAIAAAIDTVAYYPGALIPSGRKLVTESAEVHYFKGSPLGVPVTFRARILRDGKNVVKVECEAKSSAGKLAHAIVTLMEVSP